MLTFQNQEYTYRYYSLYDLAIGSLGLYRIGLSDTSIFMYKRTV